MSKRKKLHQLVKVEDPNGVMPYQMEAGVNYTINVEVQSDNIVRNCRCVLLSVEENIHEGKLI